MNQLSKCKVIFEWALSILKDGLIEPIIVRPQKKGSISDFSKDKYLKFFKDLFSDFHLPHHL